MSDPSQNLTARVFRIRPGEGRRAAAMLIYSVALVVGVVITGQLAGRATSWRPCAPCSCSSTSSVT